jgi:dUTP pyrophosphatase|tara:strand:+ start:246 stop:701 length:456 start_codon:yes stop_codon:yes gene_type:complete
MKPNNDEICEMYHINALPASNRERQDRGDAGLDLYCPSELVIGPGETKFIDLKVQCEALKDGRNVSYYLYARSSISKTPLRLANSVGIIDAGYRGNIIAAVDNHSDEQYTVKKGQRLFQIVAPGLETIKLDLVDGLSPSERWIGAFGSTGQ